MEQMDSAQAARLFIERYGNGAQMAVAQRIERARRNGDPYGAMMWRRVSHTIRDLERKASASAQTAPGDGPGKINTTRFV